MEETILLWVKDLGFPIVAFFLMYRMANNTIKENSQALRELTKEIAITKRLKND